MSTGIDLRAFKYPLDAMRKKCDWDLTALKMELAGLNTSIREKQEQIEDVKQNIAGLQADWNSRMNGGKLVDPAARSLLIAFLGQLSKEQSAYEQELQSLMQERDAVFERYAELANFAQGLDDHRESKLQEFKVEANASAAAAADDMWLQRSAWLKVRV